MKRIYIFSFRKRGKGDNLERINKNRASKSIKSNVLLSRYLFKIYKNRRNRIKQQLLKNGNEAQTT